MLCERFSIASTNTPSVSENRRTSPALALAALPEVDRKKILEGFSREQLETLNYEWRFWARPEQLPPGGDWDFWLIKTGRGWGKTRTGAETVIEWAKDNPLISLVGETAADVRDVMITGESGILRSSPPWFKPKYYPSKSLLEWPNGSIANLFSGDDPDQLRGPQSHKAWVDELAKMRYHEDMWSNLLAGNRLGSAPQVVITTTPRPLKLIRALVNDPHCVTVSGSSRENLSNLSEVWKRTFLARFEGTRLGRQEIEGEILDDVVGALWTGTQLETLRVARKPGESDRDLITRLGIVRIVVGVDPQATKSTSDDDIHETGIVVSGMDTVHKSTAHVYTLDDQSGNYSPAEWGARVCEAYHRWGADRIIGEVNQGGDMVEATVRGVDPNVSYKSVHASKGKITRAEPVAALYEQGRGHHVGQFAKLEDELTTYTGLEAGELSPNRMDAKVWAETELMLEAGDVIQTKFTGA
jgi:phage terminase large subunit-like protein